MKQPTRTGTITSALDLSPSEPSFGGRWLRVAQTIWLVLTLFVAGLYVWAVSIWINDSSYWENSWLDVPYGILMPVGYFSIAIFIIVRKPNDKMTLLTSLMLIFLGPYLISGVNVTIAQQPGWESLNHFLLGVGGGVFLLFLLIFPDGHFTPAWIRWLYYLIAIAYILSVFFSSEIYVGLSAGVILVTIISGIAVQIYRYLRISSVVQRQQTKWIVLGSLGPVFLILYWILIIVPGINTPPADLIPFYFHQSIQAGLALLFPVSLVFSIFRYRLWEIDIIINRTLVYGTLTVLVVGVYSFSIGITGLMVHTWDNLIGLLLTTVIVMLFFKPVKAGVQSGVDRLVMGDKKRPTQPPSKQLVEPSSARLSPGWLQITRVGWIILAIVVLGFLLTSLPGYFPKIGAGLPSHGVTDDPSNLSKIVISLGGVASLISAVVSLALASTLYRKKFENPAVAAIAFYLLLYSIIMTGSLEFWGSYWLGRNDFVLTLQGILMATPTVALLVLFPNGRFIPEWTRWLLLISIPWNFVAFLLPDVLSWSGNLIGITVLLVLWLMLPGLGLYAQFYRYRKVSTLDERQQTKWVLFGFVLWTGFILISSYPFFYLTSLPPGSPQPWWAAITELGWWLSVNILPVTLTIAVTRSQLWDIDIVINRTLVYGALSVATMTLYIVVVGLLGNLLQISNNTFIAFLTTGLVAILFQPLRDRLQNWVNRLMYGERDNPVAVLSKLGDELEHTGSPDDALTAIVETVAKTLKLPYVAIELFEQGDAVTAYGIPRVEVLRLPLIYQSETTGHLVVAPRSPRETFSPTERQLLENIAHQAGAAAHAAKLTAELRLSRQRLVTAREEERRRLRRDLHDGLGPTLASMTLRLDATRNLLRNDPDKAELMLEELKKQTQTTIQDVRNVVYDLRPPALDELGLVGALQGFIERHSQDRPRITLEASSQLEQLPAALEVAVYRIVLESLTNVIRHANADTARVRIAVRDGQLHVGVMDDGSGLSEDHSTGVGLASMRERAEELGGIFEVETGDGGTHIHARLPILER